MTFPIGYFHVVNNDLMTSLLRNFYRNLCIDGGYEICAEMYNKNILAPLSTFVPKVCLCDFTRAPKNRTAPMIYLSILIGQFS
jgi:hypothetical protein